MNRINNIISNLSVSISRCFYIEHDMTWSEHKTKSEYTLWCIKRGNIFLEINDKCYVANKHTAILFYPGNSYSAHTDEQGCEFVVVRFVLESGYNIDLLSDMNLAGIVKSIPEATERVCDGFEDYSRGLEGITLEHYTRFLIYINMIINIQKGEEAIRFYSVVNSSNASNVQRSIDYISENYRTVTVKQAACYAHLSEKRFILNFKNSTGMSPGQYILQCKMRSAVKMLCNTNVKIAEISSYLGYSDQYAFSKAFKHYYGESPTKFRRSKAL